MKTLVNSLNIIDRKLQKLFNNYIEFAHKAFFVNIKIKSKEKHSEDDEDEPILFI